MKNAKLTVVSMVVGLAALCVQAAQPVEVKNVAPAPAKASVLSSILDNAYVDVSAGAEKFVTTPVPLSSTRALFESVGLNLGIPITTLSNNVVLGFQIGGDVGVVQSDAGHDGQYDVTTGIFARNLPSGKNQRAAAAILLDYRHTVFNSNLLALRPIVGTTLNDKDSIGLTGTIELDNHVDDVSPVSRISQRDLDRAEIFWNHDWSSKTTTELATGVLFGDRHLPFLGANVAYAVTRNLDACAGLEANSEGNYIAGVSFVWGIGATGNHSTIDDVRSTGGTPFPKHSAFVLADETRLASKSYTPPPPPPCGR